MSDVEVAVQRKLRITEGDDKALDVRPPPCTDQGSSGHHVDKKRAVEHTIDTHDSVSDASLRRDNGGGTIDARDSVSCAKDEITSGKNEVTLRREQS